MAGSINGISSYQQTNQIWNSSKKSDMESGAEAGKSRSSDMKLHEWKPLTAGSSMIPASKEGYGTVIGDVELSDKAKEYYNSLKSKFHGMDFILVSKDMKSKVASNALSYGNANKPVVLIDDEKLEKMANDDAYRKKYEGIIAMSQEKLLAAKNSLVSSGANVKNFGLAVGEDGKSRFFASIEKADSNARKLQEKRLEAKKTAKKEEKKKAEKKAQQEKLEKKAQQEKLEKKQEYVEFRADSIEDLVNKAAKYAYTSSIHNVMTSEESMLGQSVDFKG